MSKTFFTADPHFGHTNIIRYCGRPFETKEEHDRVLIENWNNKISPRDTTYLLGDLGFGPAEYLRKVLGKLHGKIHFIRGNHDKSSILDIVGGRFASIKDVSIIHPQVNGRKQTIFLSHYAHRTWFKSNHGSWHLWGHSHNNMPPHGLSFDVGVDCWDFTPISLDEVYQKIQTLQVALDYSPE